MSIIEAKDLTRKFNGFTAVDRVSFTVEKGDIFGYLDLNGAGKTTIVKVISSLYSPQSVEIRISASKGQGYRGCQACKSS